jgi:O-antigen/teichoic acid export membrane protein
MAGGTLVAAGMMGTNIAVYGFNLVAARVLAPHQFGALTALLGILLVGTVVALGLQAVTARQLAVADHRSDAIIGAALRVTLVLAPAIGALVAASTIVLTPMLKLSSHWPVILCGATLIPLTIMGTQCGIAQGQERWRALTAVYLGNGVGRLVGGTTALIVSPTPTSAMIGLAIGSWLPVLIGLPLTTGRRADHKLMSARPMAKEAFASSHALLAYFVLSNMDSLLARNILDEHDSGLYAAGLILAKAALFFPQFVSVVVFPRLARATTGHARLKAVAIVGTFGALAVAATALLPQIALLLVGGDDYSEVSGRLWMFALAGSVLAIVHLLVFDAIARHVHHATAMIWVAVAAVAAIAYATRPDITGLVATVAAVSAALATVVYVTAQRTEYR